MTSLGPIRPRLIASFRKNARGLTFLLISLSFLAVALASLKPLWSQPGWPQNHEYNSFVTRTQIYARHFRFHDFLPIWSSVDNNGFGSPQPLFYHKLFYWVAATLLILVGTIKTALILAIVIFLLLGAWGMYFLLCALGSSRTAAITAGLSLIAANYTVTDWLIRGALAELSGSMLVPWTLLYFMRTTQEKKIHAGLGISLGLVFLAHSVLCYYLILLYATALLILLVTGQLRIQRRSVRSILVASALFVALVSPLLLAMKVVGRDYEIARMLSGVYRPVHQFQPFYRYLWDDRWHFGQTWESFTVQIDLPVTILVITVTVALVFGNQFGLVPHKQRWVTLNPVLPLVLVLGPALLLQSQITAAFYQWWPGAAFIQFPWRLLAVITPTAIAIGLYLAEETLPGSVAKFVIGVFLLSMIVSCGAFAPIRYGRLRQFDEPLAPVRLSNFGEYAPKSAPRPPYTLQQVLSYAQASGCSLEGGAVGDEINKTEFHINCVKPVRIPIPVFASRAHRLTLWYDDQPPQVTSCAPPPADFPGLCGVSLPAGQSLLEVRFPTYFSFLKSLFGRTQATVSRLKD